MRIGKAVRDQQWGWGMSHNDEFVSKRDKFMSNDLPSFYSCCCTPHWDTDWVLWHI